MNKCHNTKSVPIAGRTLILVNVVIVRMKREAAPLQRERPQNKVTTISLTGPCPEVKRLLRENRW